jgi:hypothetical protein
MAYRKYRQGFHGRANPRPVSMTIKRDGVCACCGAPIKAGEWATYYPPGTIAGVTEGKIAHCGGLDGTSQRCTVEIRKQYEAAAVNDYAGDGLDARVEDQWSKTCGR